MLFKQTLTRRNHCYGVQRGTRLVWPVSGVLQMDKQWAHIHRTFQNQTHTLEIVSCVQTPTCTHVLYTQTHTPPKTVAINRLSWKHSSVLFLKKYTKNKTCIVHESWSENYCLHTLCHGLSKMSNMITLILFICPLLTITQTHPTIIFYNSLFCSCRKLHSEPR